MFVVAAMFSCEKITLYFSFERGLCLQALFMHVNLGDTGLLVCKNEIMVVKSISPIWTGQFSHVIKNVFKYLFLAKQNKFHQVIRFIFIGSM